MEAHSRRFGIYVDGFNFYNGLVSAGLSHCRWLDYRALAARWIPGEFDHEVHYFTSILNTPPEKRERQLYYLRALKAHTGLVPIEGRFDSRRMKCPECEASWKRPKEKYTDVKMALTILEHAFDGLYTDVIIASGDADLVPVVSRLQDRFEIPVRIVIPPNRRSDDLLNASDGPCAHVDPEDMAACLLPDPVTEAYRGGRKHRQLPCPSGWN